MSKTVLALDISTTTIGISFLTYDDTSIKLTHIEDYKPNKKGELLERLVETKAYILSIIKKLNPDEIAIEKHIEYMKASNSKTILLLAIFNQMIALLSYEAINKLPHIINVNSVRAIIKPPNTMGRLSKEDVPTALEYHLGIKWEYLYTKAKRNKIAKIDMRTYDRADSCACGIAYILSQRPKIPKTKRIKKIKIAVE